MVIRSNIRKLIIVGYRGKWEKMKNIGQSIHRVNHTACIYGDNLFVFGGKDQHEKLPKSTFIALNLADNKNGWQTCDMAGYMPGILLFLGDERIKF